MFDLLKEDEVIDEEMTLRPHPMFTSYQHVLPRQHSDLTITMWIPAVDIQVDFFPG